MTYPISDIAFVVRDMCGCVAGVTVHDIAWEEQPPLPNAAGGIFSMPRQRIVITADAWGPTLHARVRRWRIDVTGAMPADPAMQTAVHAGRLDHSVHTILGYILEEQAGMAAAGATLGLDAPMPIPSRVHAHDLAHLEIDTAAADAMVAKHGTRGAVEHLAMMLVDLLVSTNGNETQLITGGTALAEFDEGACAIIPVISIPSTIRAILTGSHLELGTTIPNTLLIAATGRPLGDLVATGIAALDAATIRSATARDGEVNVALKSSRVRVTDHPGLALGLPAIIDLEREGIACPRAPLALEGRPA